MFALPRVVVAQMPASADAVKVVAPASAEADRLFEEGRRLIEAGQYAHACDVLAKSQRLEQAVGTLLNLGLCHRQCNRLASAWRFYRDAERLARKQGDAQRAELARMEAEELERSLGWVAIEVQAEPEPGLALFLTTDCFDNGGPHGAASRRNARDAGLGAPGKRSDFGSC